jgi:hypothetical protein
MHEGHLTLGKAICGWQQHLPELDTFARACEADTADTISLTLTHDRYIGIACLSIGGCYSRLDATTLTRWKNLCPWHCYFEPEHRGSPCLFVTLSSPRTVPTKRWTIQFAQLVLVVIVILCCSNWAAGQTAPESFPSVVHDVLSLADSTMTAAFAQQILP